MAETKRARRLASVSLSILSEPSGTEEDIAEFIQIAKELDPKHVIDLPEDDQEAYDLVSKTLKRMNKDNRESEEQKHSNLLLVSDPVADCFEDAGREETEYYCIVVTPNETEDEEEQLSDKVSNLYNCQGLMARKKDETMTAFVYACFKL